MNALRNLLSSRTLGCLRQNAQNALLNFTSTPVENALPVGAEDHKATSATECRLLSNQTKIIPKDLKFVGKRFHSISPGQISPTTLKHCRRLERKVELVYRCKLCNTRNSKLISELAYTSGVVILQCDGCAVDHLIIDNLGWFANTKGKSFEQVLAENSSSIKVIKVNQHGELI